MSEAKDTNSLANIGAGDYSANNIQVLEGLEAVRKRPAMYIGDVNTKGLHHMVYEVVDNSIDEALAGYCDNIDVVIHPDNSITVTDNGRGIPTGIHAKENRSALEVVMTVLHAGGKFDKNTYKVSGGLHGVGVSCVNALSQELTATVHREGKVYEQKYSRGVPLFDVKVVGETDRTGTTVHFVPDSEIFNVREYKYETIATRLRELAFLNAGIKISLTDLRDKDEDGEPEKDNFYYEGGLLEFVAYLDKSRDNLIPDPIYLDSERNGVPVQVALTYNTSFTENVVSYVNNINTIEGGTHVSGFRRALTRTLKSYADKSGLLDKVKVDISGDDFREGLTAVISVKVAEPQFEGQTKTKLGNSDVMGAVESCVGDALSTFLEEHPKESKIIINKVVLAAQARHAARKAREMVQRKNVLTGTGLPGKLADCSDSNPKNCELYLVEGDSAGGCFVGETKVALADGRSLSFLELIEEAEQGKQNYCYTLLPDGSVGIEKILYPRMTKKSTQLVKVTLDNGEEIKCTPNHKFMLRNGEYREAQALRKNDSLMPLNRKLSEIKNRITIEGYEMVLNPATHKWVFTHMLSDRYNLKIGIYEEKDGEARHHVDFNKRNNNPTNLIRLSKEDHLKIHQDHLQHTLHREDVKEKCRKTKRTAEFREKMSKRMKEPATREILSQQAKKQWEDDAYKAYMVEKFLNFYTKNEEYRLENNQRLLNNQKEYWSKKENRAKQSDQMREYFMQNPEKRKVYSIIATEQWQNEDLLAWRKQKTSEQWTEDFRAKRKEAYDKTYFEHTMRLMREVWDRYGSIENFDKIKREEYPKRRNVLKIDNFAKRYFSGNTEQVTDAVSHYNHKVHSVEFLTETQDVFDIEVPDTHNFALSSGVFVHNSAKQGRERMYQAILPLRGKILNVEKAQEHKIYDNEEIKNMITAMGVSFGTEEDDKALNMTKLRYHKIIIMTDADVDGSHIRTLILTFFFRYMRALIESGYLYIALPPLYLVRKGKEERYIWSEAEREAAVKELAGDGKVESVSVQRYKGLGEMNPEQLWETTMNPETRSLKLVTIDSAAEADHLFSMLMGDEVAPRREFIEKNAKYANLDI
ncbi:MAG: DNA topoisomerase (ATP-hydrolyzing) subunit B [Tunicatimonas sp.]|uniref:DNA topoisomerase (ATP-hydrolyzing) subunit B n=1 Tax=Tunicatimonas sp. TaxID=1940096 RepID=UPI003C78ACE9